MNLKDKIYGIHAYEGQYGGRYGIEDADFFCCNFREACRIAEQMSINVIETFNTIHNCKSAEEYDHSIKENIAYGIYEMPDYFSLEELRQIKNPISFMQNQEITT